MILAIVQARVSSSRLPGKVLKPILNKPMIVHQIDRIKNSKLINKIVLATSENSSDDALVEVCSKYEIEVYRGSLENVLERFYKCAKNYVPEQIIRLTGDCPLIDWNIIDRTVELHLIENNDYTSNTLEPTYPDGLDVEVMSYNALEMAYRNARLPSEKEHVTPYIYNHKELFKVGCLKNNIDLSGLRWTVDETEDFEVITQIYETLFPKNPKFLLEDILIFLNRNPGIVKINSLFKRNEGMLKSLGKEKMERRIFKWRRF